MSHKCNLKKKADFIGNSTNKCMRAWQSLFLVSPKNPYCARFFRSETAIREEKKRQLDSKYIYVIHPMSEFRAWYEVWLCFVHTSALILKPVDAGFSRSHELFAGYRILSTVVDIWCIMDVILNFFTGYIVTDNSDDHQIEIRTSKIALHYLRSPYFICDLLSSIPRNAFYWFGGRPHRALVGTLNVCAMFKLARLWICPGLFNRVALFFDIQSKGFIFLFNCLYFSIIVIHWMACMQFGIPRLADRYFVETPTTESWFYERNLEDAPLRSKYLHSFFRSSAFILGIRLGLYNPHMMTTETVLIIFTYVIGKLLIGTIWVILAMTIINSRSIKIKYKEVINQLDEYMKQKRLPLDLRKRIFQYYDFKYQRKYFKEEMVTNLLSTNLRTEVNVFVCRSLISKVSIFSALTSDQLSSVVAKLSNEIFLPKDIIVQAGTVGDAMYFLASGTVAVYTHSGKEVCHLQDGSYFGELPLILKGHTRPTTIIAIECTQVYKLSKRNFELGLLRNKEVYKKIYALAELRLRQTTQIEEQYKKKVFEETYQAKMHSDSRS